jgi:hypothetical protein
MGETRQQGWGVMGKRARRHQQLLAALAREGLAYREREDPAVWGGVEVPSGMAWEATTLAQRVAVWEQRLRTLPRRVRRALQRRCARSLAELALLFALGQAPVWAATINVDGTTCTLVDAITAANNDTATGGCTAGSGDDTLVLPAGGTFTLTTVNNSTLNGATGLPVVTSTITIAGHGSTVERQAGAPAFRLLAVGAAGNLTGQDLVLQGGQSDTNTNGGAVWNNGTLTLISSTISGNSANLRGGGIYNDGGTVTLTNSTLSGNTAGTEGGGLYTYFGAVTLVNSTVSGNTAGTEGGGLYNFSATLNLVNSTVSGNTATTDGGGVYNRGGTVSLVNSTVSGNTADQGGGVYNRQGTLTLNASTISGNSANPYGGGVFDFQGTVTLTNSTLSGNTAASQAGGMVTSGGTATLVNSTVTGNTATNLAGGLYSYNGSFTLLRSLISGNSAPTAREMSNSGGTVTADAVNLFGYSSDAGVVGFAPGASDLVPNQALGIILNTTLAFNGGPTQTHDLVSGSPAVAAVPAASCPATDQRGLVRPTGENCDIGAVELNAAAPPVVNSQVSFVAQSTTFSTTTDTTGCPGGVVGKFFFQATLTNLAGNPPLAALKDEVVELTNSNQVLTADGGAAGVGSMQTLPQVGNFSDGELEAGGTVQVPFVICLQNLNPFRFTVNVLGLQTGP